VTEPIAYLYTSPSGAQELWFTPLSAREHAQGWTAVPLYAAEPNVAAPTLRDQFAMAALPDCLAINYGLDDGWRDGKHPSTATRRAYKIADAMMEARK
jgi:hypothetical protein